MAIQFNSFISNITSYLSSIAQGTKIRPLVDVEAPIYDKKDIETTMKNAPTSLRAVAAHELAQAFSRSHAIRICTPSSYYAKFKAASDGQIAYYDAVQADYQKESKT